MFGLHGNGSEGSIEKGAIFFESAATLISSGCMLRFSAKDRWASAVFLLTSVAIAILRNFRQSSSSSVESASTDCGFDSVSFIFFCGLIAASGSDEFEVLAIRICCAENVVSGRDEIKCVHQ